MTPDGTAALITSGESEMLEFRETTGTCREAAKTVCAFLNQSVEVYSKVVDEAKKERIL